jgi:hypothetical protein
LDDSRFVQLNHGLVAQVLLQPGQRVEGRPHRPGRRCLRSATRPIRNSRWNLPSFRCCAQTYVRSFLIARFDFETDSCCCITGLMRSIFTRNDRRRCV